MTTITVIPSITVTFKDIQDVFGGSDPISLSEYYTDSTPGLTTGVTGLPALNNPISLSMFRGKSKGFIVTPIATIFTGRYRIFTNATGGDTSSYVTIGGIGENLSRTGVSTFDNTEIGSTTYGRERHIYYPNLILQAKAGDTIGITIKSNGRGPITNYLYDYTYQEYHINYGTSWNDATKYKYIEAFNPLDTPISSTFTDIVPETTIKGSYPICIFTAKYKRDYSRADGALAYILTDCSFNYYTLQIYE